MTRPDDERRFSAKLKGSTNLPCLKDAGGQRCTQLGEFMRQVLIMPCVCATECFIRSTSAARLDLVFFWPVPCTFCVTLQLTCPGSGLFSLSCGESLSAFGIFNAPTVRRFAESVEVKTAPILAMWTPGIMNASASTAEARVLAPRGAAGNVNV